MTSESSTPFATQLALIRNGDVDAINAFVATYEQYIRRTLRFRLRRASLQPIADSVDVCQSVLGSFLLRLSAGEYEVHSEEDLRKLLSGIANKKFLMLALHEAAEKRNRGCNESLNDRPELECKNTDDPSRRVTLNDLREAVVVRLSSHELELFSCRNQGISWKEIGAKLDEDPVLLRKRLSRAIERIEIELGLEDSHESG